MGVRHCVVCDGYQPEAELKWFRVPTDADGGRYLEAVHLGVSEPWAGLKGVCEGCRVVIAASDGLRPRLEARA